LEARDGNRAFLGVSPQTPLASLEAFVWIRAFDSLFLMRVIAIGVAEEETRHVKAWEGSLKLPKARPKK